MRVVPVGAPVRQETAARLRDAIRSRQFLPGERLLEKQLCELTGVSRTSVREALRQLESEGLVEIVPNRGPIVATVSQTQAISIYQVREVLESLAGMLCARRATASEVSELSASVDAVEEAVRAGDMSLVLHEKDVFYDLLFRFSGNETAAKLLATLHARISLLRAATLAEPGRPTHTVSELRAIIRAISEGDAEKARDVCAQHVRNAAAVAIRSLAGPSPS
ncbi:GntR family transcriptional regulator [Actinophytocola sp.]|uniref:GntR family transcriptional regulator n=1 Tax=Actinophytocola sp. TaxID=1872138 RepID=UPI003D6B3ECE